MELIGQIEGDNKLRIVSKRFICMAVAYSALGMLTPASAQALEKENEFSGSYAGIAAGIVDHHFVAVEESAAGRERRFNVTRWGEGGEIFAGYNFAISRRVLVGGEAQFEFGGRSATVVTGDYVYGFKPRYGYSLSGRVGYSPVPALLTYAGVGFGEHRYRTIAEGNVSQDAVNDLNKARSVVLRAGAEWQVSRRANVRLEFEHLDGSRNQFMLGLPIRF